MGKKSKLIHAFMIGACLGAAHCERKLESDDDVAEKCLMFCADAACADAVDVTSCKDDCIAAEADAEAIGETCHDIYLKLVSCVAELGCNNAALWIASRGGENTEESSCGPETHDFLKACPDVWFEENQ